MTPQNSVAAFPAAPTDVAHAQAGITLLSKIQSVLEDSKAEDIVSIDLDGKSALADTMLIASGRSQRHVSSIADHVQRAMKDAGFGNPRIEGLPHADWVLIDAGDVILHLFRPEVRSFYNMEKLWGDSFSDPASAGTQ